MAENPRGAPRQTISFETLSQLADPVRLDWQLLKSKDIRLREKLPALGLLAGALIYTLSPVDLIPDWFPVLGQLDDLGAWIFVLGYIPETFNALTVRAMRTKMAAERAVRWGPVGQTPSQPEPEPEIDWRKGVRPRGES